MARTFIRQDIQIGPSGDTQAGYVDNLALAATLETGAVSIADDLNGIRSVLHQVTKLQTGNWYDDLAVPATFTGEGETQRGVDNLNVDLHELERKRFLRRRCTNVAVTVPSAQNFVILAAGELPGNTTAAVDNVATLGTVVASHTGTFGTHSLDEVAGANPCNPKSLVDVVDSTTGDPITSAGRTVYGLIQSENATDGHTITDTTPDRVQLSFVRNNATATDLEAAPVADIENAVIRYTARERVGFDDLNEQDLLSDSVADAPAGVSVTLQAAYDGQGATPVDATNAAILDLEGPGLVWQIRDDLEAALFTVTEGSAGGTSSIAFGTDVDTFDNDATVNDFAAGATLNSGGTRPIAVGVTDGVIESTAGDLRVNGTGELFLDDGNQPGSWAQTDGIKLSEAAADWSTWETNFGGELSIMEAVNATYALAQVGGNRTRVQATCVGGGFIAAGTDINGPGTPHANTDVDLAPFDAVSFLTDVDIFLNGELLRNSTTPGQEDVNPGGTPADGDLQFTFNLRANAGRPDQITVIVNGQ